MLVSEQQSEKRHLRPLLIHAVEQAAGGSVGVAGDDVLLFDQDVTPGVHQVQAPALPAYRIVDADSALRFSRSGVREAFVVSRDPGLIVAARAGSAFVHGVLDLRDQADLDPLEVRTACNASGSRVILLAWRHARFVRHLQRRAMTVWLAEPADREPGTAQNLELLNSGADGLVVSDTARLHDLLARLEEGGRVNLWRRPFVIGHRGLPSRAPENTIESARLALEHGAEILECDIRLTADGEVVVHHDDTLERTTDGTGPVSSFSLAELRQVRVNRQFPAFEPAPALPTLRDYLAEFRQTGVVHFLELKDDNPGLLAPTVEIVRWLGLEDQVVFISFHDGQLRKLQELLPGASVGHLTTGLHDGDLGTALERTFIAVARFGATYNPGREGLKADFVSAAAKRGLSVWPWTFREHAGFCEAFLSGLGGLTTDYADWAMDWLDELRAPVPQVNLAVGESWWPVAFARSVSGREWQAVPEVEVLQGGDVAVMADGLLVGRRPGSAVVAFRLFQALPRGGYWRWSGPVRVSVGGRRVNRP